MKVKVYKRGFKVFLIGVFSYVMAMKTQAQTAPGGVNTGLRAWYKANAIAPVLNGTDIFLWTDQASEDGVQNAVQNSLNTTANLGNRSPQYRTASSRYNFNPYLDFSKAYSSLMAYQAHSNIGDQSFNFTEGATLYQVGDLSNVQGWYYGTGLGASTTLDNGYHYEWGYPWLGVNAEYYTTAYGFYWGTGNDWWYNNTRKERKVVNNTPWINTILYDKYGTNNGVYLAGSDAQTALQTRKDGDRWSWGYSFTPAGPSLYIGNELTNYNAGRWWKGCIPEVILYNRKLSTQMGGEADRVDSYLALKYGITLSHNYFISDGTKAWDTAINSLFNNQIAGLARDNASALNQKQSRSIYNTPIVTMSAGDMAENDNSFNTGVLADKQTLIWGTDKTSGNLINGGPFPGGFENFQTAVGGPVAGINISSIAYTKKKWLVQEQTGKDAGVVKVYIESKDVRAIDWSLNTYIMVGSDANFSNPRFYPFTLAASTTSSTTDYVADVNFCEGAPNPSTIKGGIKAQYFAIAGAKKIFLPGGVNDYTVWCRADFGVYSDSLTQTEAAPGDKVMQWVNFASTHDAYSGDSANTAPPLFKAASVYDNFNPMVDFSASTANKGVGMYLLDVNKYTGTTSWNSSNPVRYNTFYGFSSNRAVTGGRQVAGTISATNYGSPAIFPQSANNATGSGNYANYGYNADAGYSLGRAPFRKNENIIASSYVDTTDTYYENGSTWAPNINQSNWRNGRDSATLSGAALASFTAPANQATPNQNQYVCAPLESWYDYLGGLGFRPEHAVIGDYRGFKSGARDNYGNTPFNWTSSPSYPTDPDIAQNTGTYIQEVISFQRKLTRNERERVQTYLGIRNGSTIYHNYLATNSTVIFDTAYTDAAPNGGAPNNRYTYSITGIGRDDIESLDQRVSRNCLDTLVTIALGAIPSDQNNKSVDVSFENDKEYIIWGSNGGNQNIRATTDLPLLSGCLDSRLNREYHIHLTGSNTGNYATQVRWQLDNNILDAVSVSGIQLLIDDNGDGNFQTGAVRAISATSYDAATRTLIFDDVSWTTTGDVSLNDAVMTIGWNSGIKGAALYGRSGAGNEGGGCNSCDDPDYSAGLLCTTYAGTSLYGNNTTGKVYLGVDWRTNTSNCSNAGVTIRSNTANAARRKTKLGVMIGGSKIDSAAVMSARLHQIIKNASCTIDQPVKARVYFDPLEVSTDSAWLNGGGNVNQPLITDSTGLQWFIYNGDMNSAVNNFSASGFSSGQLPGQALLIAPDFVGMENGIMFAEFNDLALNATTTIGWLQRRVGMSNLPFFKSKVLLQGAMQGTTMRDDLRKGFSGTGRVIPVVQPYNVPAFGNYAGNDSVPQANIITRFADLGNNSVVDWVLLEFRDKANPTTIISKKAYLVQRDGDIIDPATGSDTLYIGQAGISLDNYYVSVRHRNHLGVMLANTIDFTAPFGALVDFTDISKDLYNSTVLYNGKEAAQIGGKWALWAGDANSNGNVKMSLIGNDQVFISNSLMNHPANATHDPLFTVNGYFNADINMNGQLKRSLIGNDQVALTNFVLLNTLNAGSDRLFVLLQQLP